MYTLYNNIIPGIPVLAFRNGKPEGVVAHSTCPGSHNGSDTPLAEANYEARTWNNAFVHAFVGVENGQAVIRQTAPFNQGAWGAGRVSNARHLHIELCEYDDPTLFKLSYDAYVTFLAKLLVDNGLPCTPAKADGTGTLWGHFQVSEWLGGTDHDDPTGYLESHGVSWDKFLNDVLYCYNVFNVPAKPAEPQPIGVATILVDSLNVRSTASASADNVVGQVHKGEAYKVWYVKNGMYNVGGAQFISGNSQYVSYKSY